MIYGRNGNITKSIYATLWYNRLLKNTTEPPTQKTSHPHHSPPQYPHLNTSIAIFIPPQAMAKPKAPHVHIDLGDPTSPTNTETADFERRAGDIQQNLSTLDNDLKRLNHLLTLSKKTFIHSSHLSAIETRITSTRSQLTLLAAENKRVAKAGTLGPSSLRIRVTRFSKLTADFTAFLKQFETSSGHIREQIGQGIADDVRELGLGQSNGDVVQAVEQGRLEPVLERASPEIRFQVQELRERNQAFAQLNRDVANLHEMFVELSFLAENQQSLINDIEHNIEDTKGNVGKADEEIIEARRHQKSATKKKLIIAAIIAIILLILIVVLVVALT